jgi:hypothetical protein
VEAWLSPHPGIRVVARDRAGRFAGAVAEAAPRAVQVADRGTQWRTPAPASSPRTITADKNPAYPRAVAEMKRDGELWRLFRLRRAKLLNSIVEQDRRRVKHLVRPGLGFGGVRTARRTLAGCDAMAVVRKGQVWNIDGRDMRVQAGFFAELFEVTA